MTREEAIEILKRVDICANAAETARDMAIAALRAEEGVAQLSNFLQEKMREQGNCCKNGNSSWISEIGRAHV